LTQRIKINEEVRQGKPFHRFLHIHIYIYHIITERKEEEIKGIHISRNKNIKTFFFSRATNYYSDDPLQISVRKLESVTSKYKLQISSSQT